MRTSKYFKKNPFAKYALSRSAAAKYLPRARVSRILASASSFHRGEVKSVDGISGQASNIIVPMNTTHSNEVLMNGVDVGTNYYNRIGRRIEMQSLHLKGVITQTGTATATMDYCRLAVVYDRQSNGAVCPANLVFQDTDSTGGATGVTPSSGVNPDYRERFAVLADIKLALPATAAAGLQDNAVDGTVTTFNINRFIKLRNLKTHYGGDGDTQSSITTGALWLIPMGNFASGGWQFIGTWRLRYADT